MKICIIVTGLPPDFVGGTEFQAYEIASKLAKKHDVTVLTRSVNGKVSEISENGFKIRRFGFIDFPVIRFLSHIVSSFNEVRKIRKETDVLLCMMLSPNGLVGALSKIFFKTKTISSIRGTDWYMAGFFGNLINKFVVRNSDIILSQTKKTQSEVNKKFPNAKTDVLYNGVDIDGSTSIGKGLIFVGSLREVKGVSYLIDAMDDIDSELVIIGDGPMRDELERNASGKKIIFKGKLNKKDVKNHMLNSGVLVLPSLSEGLPNVILEAMSIGLPVVATDVSGISEIVKDGKTGFLVKPCDSKALSSSINVILKDEHLRKRMKSNAFKEIKKYSWDNTVSRIEVILNHVTKKR